MDVITHPEVDAVWICSPSQYHADQVRFACEEGSLWYFPAVRILPSMCTSSCGGTTRSVGDANDPHECQFQ